MGTLIGPVCLGLIFECLTTGKEIHLMVPDTVTKSSKCLVLLSPQTHKELMIFELSKSIPFLRTFLIFLFLTAVKVTCLYAAKNPFDPP